MTDIIIIILMVFMLAGLVAIDNKLEVIIRHQTELIKAIKNSNK